jgi:hypothetical protein
LSYSFIISTPFSTIPPLQDFIKICIGYFTAAYVITKLSKITSIGGKKIMAATMYVPDDMEIIDGMPASKPKDPDRVRAPWEE